MCTELQESKCSLFKMDYKKKKLNKFEWDFGKSVDFPTANDFSGFLSYFFFNKK